MARCDNYVFGSPWVSPTDYHPVLIRVWDLTLSGEIGDAEHPLEMAGEYFTSWVGAGRIQVLLEKLHNP